jgi:hypothetical protein
MEKTFISNFKSNLNSSKGMGIGGGSFMSIYIK